jgi:hypothetical protein
VCPFLVDDEATRRWTQRRGYGSFHAVSSMWAVTTNWDVESRDCSPHACKGRTQSIRSPGRVPPQNGALSKDSKMRVGWSPRFEQEAVEQGE